MKGPDGQLSVIPFAKSAVTEQQTPVRNQLTILGLILKTPVGQHALCIFADGRQSSSVSGCRSTRHERD